MPRPWLLIQPVEAVRMLELFGSIGATHFDITHTHLCGEKRGFRRNQAIAETIRSIPYLVASAEVRQNNVIVRPRVAGPICIQLDDLDREKTANIARATFLTLETSPGNYQAWVAITEALTGTTARLQKGIGADLNASGATRVAGSRNYKPKYAPAFPIVRITHAQPGRLVSVPELAALGVLAPETAPVETVRPDTARPPARSWPSYERCLDGAPVGPSGRPQRTSVDFTWCMIAASWGHGVEATAARLLKVSSKAHENGENYARKTAERATWAAAQRR
jgi:hypothetical protein